MAKNNPQRTTASGPAPRRPFYTILVLIVVLGVAAILYEKNSAKHASPEEANAEYEALRQKYANAGPPQPYVRGNPNAPVVIEEFADYECPSCGNFATVTEPDVRQRIVDAGLALYKYYDFPLPMHHNSRQASLAAACADEQGKFWQMHDQLFATQDQWGLAPNESEVTDNPTPVFQNLAKTIGLDMTKWQQCYDSKKYEPRVMANMGEALRRNIDQTPTFYVNGMKIAGAIPYDQLKQAVDNAAKQGPMSTADSALNNIVSH
jgi:protein-disulfide isomerase